MFCSKCGNPDQESDAYCRRCGEYLFDPAGSPNLLSRLLGRTTLESQIKINTVISGLTIFACFFLIGFLGGHYDAQYERTGETTPWVIYLVYAFLTLISLWQIFSLVSGKRLKNKLNRKGVNPATQQKDGGFAIKAPETQELLPEADYSPDVPSVTEDPTRILDPVKRTRS